MPHSENGKSDADPNTAFIEIRFRESPPPLQDPPHPRRTRLHRALVLILLLILSGLITWGIVSRIAL